MRTSRRSDYAARHVLTFARRLIRSMSKSRDSVGAV